MEKGQIAAALRQAHPSVLLGIDGMVDEVWELLSSRSGPEEYVKMTKLMEFGAAISERRTGGLAIERILKRRSSGGFVANTGRAAATLGAATAMLGMFGENQTDPAFYEFQNLSTLISLGEPPRMYLLEFSDGKIMLPNLETLIGLTWTDVVERLGDRRLRELCDVDIMGVGYWSNLYDFEHMMTALVTDYLRNGRTKRVFHDFANLNKRSPQALSDALAVLEKLNAQLPQTLSLNEHEGGILAGHLGIPYPGNVNRPECEGAVLAAAEEIRRLTNLDEVIIHTQHFAVAATGDEGSASVPQDYCTRAVKTTGAGDTFNGAYMVASMTPLPPAGRLLAANAATRYYVERGVPPTMEQLIARIEQSSAQSTSP